MAYNLLINGVYWGYNPLTNPLLTSWDIQVYSPTYSGQNSLQNPLTSQPRRVVEGQIYGFHHGIATAQKTWFPTWRIIPVSK